MKFFLDKESQYDLIAYTTKTLHMHTDLAFATSHPVVRWTTYLLIIQIKMCNMVFSKTADIYL